MPPRRRRQRRNDTVDRLNRQARTVVGQAGLLEGPPVTAGDREFQAGDRVVCLKNRTRLGVLNGDLAIVRSVDIDQRTITLRLDRTEQPVTVPSWYLDEGNVDWGYALTGHKAQGATARRAHTVASAGVDRAWIYVTMSRGREANTVYLTAPELDDEECTHLAHQHQGRLLALATTLARTAGESAALDSGRGPQLLSDEELTQTIASLEASRGRDVDDPIGDDGSGRNGDYSRLVREVETRHRDRLTAIRYSPPPWIVNAIGERPPEPDRARAWDRIVDQAVRYRDVRGIPEEAQGLVGPPPQSRDVIGRTEWIACRRRIEVERQTLDTVKELGMRAASLG